MKVPWYIQWFFLIVRLYTMQVCLKKLKRNWRNWTRLKIRCFFQSYLFRHHILLPAYRYTYAMLLYFLDRLPFWYNEGLLFYQLQLHHLRPAWVHTGASNMYFLSQFPTWCNYYNEILITNDLLGMEKILSRAAFFEIFVKKAWVFKIEGLNLHKKCLIIFINKCKMLWQSIYPNPSVNSFFISSKKHLYRIKIFHLAIN